MTIRSVAFDLDGTLVDSAPDILETLGQAVAEAGIRSEVEMTTALIGPPVSQMLKTWGADLTDIQIAAALAAFRRLYDKSPLPKTLPYPGIMKCLSDLQAAGCMLYVTTNKPHHATAGILERHFHGRFEGFCCVDSLPGRTLSKEEMLHHLAQQFNLAANESVIVGDGESDLRAGRALGWRTLAVLYGYGSVDDLRREDPTWMVTSPNDIADFLT